MYKEIVTVNHDELLKKIVDMFSLVSLSFVYPRIFKSSLTFIKFPQLSKKPSRL